ncbi:MAG TPA: ComEC/Rec2 family competence protein, partial [Vicingus sp.]|nr:ComEC/Rec2 family competence protein [Vicingus sp.]
ASALILGYKNNIEAQLKSAYSSAGAMHVLAVSGLHVGIIFMIFNVLLKFTEKFKYGGIIKGIILLLVLWFYALITGLSPSVLRSATMFSFVVSAKMINRRTNFFNTLSASALLLLLVNPFLIFDVGFQLSYSAVIGIVLIQPWFSKLLSPTTWLGNYTWDLVTVSLAAQIATFPLGLYYFHQFPNYFLLANLLVIPFAVIILCLGLFTLAVSFIPIISFYSGLALKWIIFSLNWVVSFIDQMPYAVTNQIKFTLSDAIFVYFIIGFILLLFVYRKFYYFALASVTTLLLLTSIGFDKFKLLNQKKLIVYNIPKHTAINFIDGNDNILVSDIMLSKDKLKFHVENNWIDKGIKAEKVVNLENLKKEHLISNLYKIDNQNLFTKRNYFQYYHHKIAIIDKNFKVFIPQEKLNVDFIIWTQNCKIPLEKLIQIFQFKKLIIDSSNSTYINDKLVNEAKQLKIEYWSVQENGAFELDV